MEIYLVGGAVRDKLMGIEPKDLDYVVVGASVQEMLDAGYEQVGADFPVFLHPETKDEYALARTERKTGVGYNGFTTETNGVTLEEDLERRDLTINAIAMDKDGNVIDPFGGVQDIKDRTLRHVSDAFAEDPLRVLRVARFMARYTDFNITIDTVLLMHTLVDKGELNTLTPERVWKETDKALSEIKPSRYFNTLDAVGAIDILFPEFKQLGIKRAVGVYTDIEGSPVLRFAAIARYMPPSFIDRVCERLRIPNEYKRAGRAAAELDWGFATGEDLMKLYEDTDAFRRPEALLEVAKLLDDENDVKTIVEGLDAARQVSGAELIKAGRAPGPALGGEIRGERVRVLNKIVDKYTYSH